MHTIASHLILATVLVTRHIAGAHPRSAVHAAAAPASALGLAILVLIVALVALWSMAARGMTTLISEFLRVAASMTSVLFVMLVAVIVAVVLIAHP